VSNHKESLESGKFHHNIFAEKTTKIFLLLQNLTFAIFAASLVAIITNTDCTTCTVVAFGVCMATVSVAWVRFCEKTCQRIHYMILFVQLRLCDLHKHTRFIAHQGRNEKGQRGHNALAAESLGGTEMSYY